ncbi:gamma-glutamylputrescine oxidase [Crenobacter luteus]|uniref:NAD(P)/FAD-dependent oxidoreductase n=1 Tax=Crenobacter luteus TaxID=1452487 RepID=UPI00104738AC|nr:FAD-binding oxidoreductase [Crenobacter luteus]TCP13047.1 gamma-glutamylputrescine oxidase [Crenobacter luteus]
MFGSLQFAGREHVESWYAASAGSFTPRPRLGESLTADVCVVGAGYTGLSAALELAERGYRVVVLEGARVGWGASGRNGGQVLSDLACGMNLVRDELGQDAAREIWNMTREAVELVGQRCAKYDIDAELVWGYFHAALKERQLREQAAWQEDAARHYGYDRFELVGRDRLPEMVASERYVGGLFEPDAGHLHPLKYAQGLARAAEAAGVRIFEHSAVSGIVPGATVRVAVGKLEVRAESVVLAGNTYLGQLVPELDKKIMPVGTYLIATEPLGEARARALIPKNLAVCDANFVLDYFRFSRDTRLLFGGRVSYTGMTPVGLRDAMRRSMLKVFPGLADAKVEYDWGGFVDITMNRAPHFGRVQPNVFFAQGFSGHGVALTGLAGRLMAEAIDGEPERFDLFARLSHRSFPGGALLRTPALLMATSYYRLRDYL